MSYSGLGNSGDFGGEDSEENEEFAKYWSDYHQEVVKGVKKREEPIDLKDICGTYSWFYEIPSASYGDPYEVFYDKRNRFPKAPGHMTISSPAGGVQVTPADISGEIDHFGKTAKFKGLEPGKTINFLLIKKLEWETGDDENQETDNGLCILDACDDDDNPFVLFSYNTGWSGCMQHFLDIVGKKQKEGSFEPVYLTDTERERLGMGLLASDIKADALEEGDEPGWGGEEDEDEEDDEDEEGDEDGEGDEVEEDHKDEDSDKKEKKPVQAKLKHAEDDTKMVTEEQKQKAVKVDKGKVAASAAANEPRSVQSSSQTKANKRKNPPRSSDGGSPNRKRTQRKA